jgi:hypothetical protein
MTQERSDALVRVIEAAVNGDAAPSFAVLAGLVEVLDLIQERIDALDAAVEGATRGEAA